MDRKSVELTDELRATLKEMWRLDEKDKKGEKFTHEESIYYRNHQKVICQYYQQNYDYWYYNVLNTVNIP
jgi:hypothetical protein